MKTYYRISQIFPFALFVSSVVALSDYIFPIGGARKKGYRQRGSFSTNADARKTFCVRNVPRPKEAFSLSVQDMLKCCSGSIL